jgi:glutamate formiminotransferase
VPDAGPARLHPTAGAVLVGVRPPLVALNVWLPTATVTDAKAIAARVRETGGGPLGVRALGLYLHDAGMAQVSMNIEDTRRTPIGMAIDAVRRDAERLEVEVGEVELVGLIAAEALQGVSPAALGIRSFSPGKLVDLYLGRHAEHEERWPEQG